MFQRRKQIPPVSTSQCSFCGKQQDKVERLIAGPGNVVICNECVDLCQQIIQDGRKDQPPTGGSSWKSAPATFLRSKSVSLRKQNK